MIMKLHDQGDSGFGAFGGKPGARVAISIVLYYRIDLENEEGSEMEIRRRDDHVAFFFSQA